MNGGGPVDSAGIARRVARLFERIETACHRGGRNLREVTLVAASKTMPVEAIRAAAEAGVAVFGENRVQEAIRKIEALPGLHWHMIGTLQRNKARKAIDLFEMIHSVDSLELGLTLERLGRERHRPVEALLEVNVGGEETKGGFPPGEIPETLRRLAGLEGLRIRGLMAIPPPVADPEESRRPFRTLRQLAEDLDRLSLPLVAMQELSMGMSDDFEIAIEEGATLIRVGTALFGPRYLPV